MTSCTRFLGIAAVAAGLFVFLSVAPVGRAAELRFSLEAASAEDFARPHDVVLSPDGSKLYVADNGNHRIAVLDALFLTEIGSFGSGEVREPHDVVFDGEGRLLVADTGNNRIAIYEVSGSGGRLAGQLAGGIRGPEGVDVHSDGRVLATGAQSGNLVVFQEGRIIKERGGFSAPHDITVAPDGSLWVADSGNNRMVQLDEDLRMVRVLAGGVYAFSGPRYQDFDSSGRMFVADKYSNQIKIIAPDGALLQVLGTKRAGRGDGLFDRPEGVEIRDNQAWFADTYNNRIVRYRVDASP